jgi:hypothetical protein
MPDDITPESIGRVRQYAWQAWRLTNDMLACVGEAWTVDPLLFIDNEATRKKEAIPQYGYHQILAREAERALMHPCRYEFNLEDQRRWYGLPYIHPIVSIQLGEVAKWLEVYNCPPRDSDFCEDFSNGYQGDGPRLVCMAKGEGYPSFRKGKFTGNLDKTTVLGNWDYIPVHHFGDIEVPGHLIRHPRLVEGFGNLFIVAMSAPTSIRALKHSLKAIGLRVARDSEIAEAEIRESFHNAVGLNPEKKSYAIMLPSGRAKKYLTLDGDLKTGDLVYAVADQT